MKRFTRAISACALGWAIALPASAHTARHQVLDAPGISVEFGYSDGSAMSFAEVKVYAPGSSTTPRQVGRADADGRFAFVPNGDGVWRLSARDDEGHTHDAEVNISGGTASSGSWWRRGFLFGSVFLNFALLALLLELRKAAQGRPASALMNRFIGRS